MKKIKKTIVILSVTLAALGCSKTSSNPPRGNSVAPGAGTGSGGLGVGPAPVALGLAGNFAVLAESGISSVPNSNITGNIGISPAAASFITGFSLSSPPSTFATSTQVSLQVFASNYNPPTPANMTTSIANMHTAYTDAAGRPADHNELATGAIGGMILPPAVYKWSTGVLISTDVALSGGANDVWIFEVAGNLTMASGARISLLGGAQAKNIFWQVAGAVDLGTTSHFEGVLLGLTSIALRTGATANARLLAQTAVTLDQNTVTQPQ